MEKQYSRQALTAFIVLLITYGLIVGMLTLLQNGGILKFSTETKGDLLPLMASLPFVALYLLVLIAATAGFARGAIMARTLPFNQILKSELQQRKMEGAAIKTKIRSGEQVTKDTPYLRALNNVISSRVPILAVIGNDKKVAGVITNDDIIRKLQEEIDKNDPTTLDERLKKLAVKDLHPRDPVVATINENLQEVLGSMIRHQFTKLIVVDERSNSFAGTVDALFLVGELFEGAPTD